MIVVFARRPASLAPRWASPAAPRSSGRGSSKRSSATRRCGGWSQRPAASLRRRVETQLWLPGASAVPRHTGGERGSARRRRPAAGAVAGGRRRPAAGRTRMTMVETLRRLTGRSSDVVDRLAGPRTAPSRPRAAGSTTAPGRRGAREIVERAGGRLRLSGEHTVVALAGATGSGKSSLFNGSAASTWPLSASSGRPRRGRWPARGGRRARARCSTGSSIPKRHQVSRDGHARRDRGRPRPAGTGPARPARPRLDRGRRTTSRSSGWWSSPTSWCGCSIRRSTPTPRSTTGSSARCTRTATS